MLAQFWAHLVIPGAAIIGIIFAVSLWLKVSKVTVAGNSGDDNREYLLEEQRGDQEVRFLPRYFHTIKVFDVCILC